MSRGTTMAKTRRRGIGKVATAGALGALLLCGGCCNIGTRFGATRRTPVFCAPSPYYCTATLWTDCVCAPFRAFGGGVSTAGRTWDAVATVTWPFWVVDEVCEVALDTVFLPVDVIYSFNAD